MAKEIKCEADARAGMAQGVKKLADALPLLAKLSSKIPWKTWALNW